MRRFLFLVVVSLMPVRGHAITRECGAASDLVVQALERVGPDSSKETVRDANELLKRAERMCSELGDAWYYRSVFEARLGLAAPPILIKQATLMESQAMNDKLDPFVLAAPKDKGPPPTPHGGTRWALVIGIGSFSDSSIQPLPYTADDATLFAQTLKNPAVGGFPVDHVRSLINADATTAGIRAGLNWIARNAKPEDIVVIYIATHGSPRERDSVAGANYFVTRDTNNDSQDMLFGTALPINDLVATVANRISSRRTAIFIDTCFSGSARAQGHGESVSERDLQRFGQGEGRVIMAASRSDQQSRENDELHHGYFTYFLVEALRSQGASRKLSDVYQTVAKEVSAHVAADFSPMDVRQDPVLSRSSDGTDFALGPSGQ